MLICTSPHQEYAVGRVANMVNCAILLVKSKGKGSNSLHYLAFGPTVQVLSTNGVTVVVKWVTLHFALGITVLRN